MGGTSGEINGNFDLGSHRAKHSWRKRREHLSACLRAGDGTAAYTSRNSAPPSGFTAVTGWAHVYQEAGAPAYSNPNASVEIANSKTYVHLKATGEWVLVQNQATIGITGGQFVTDFAGPTRSMRVGAGSGGSTAIRRPSSRI